MVLDMVRLPMHMHHLWAFARKPESDISRIGICFESLWAVGVQHFRVDASCFIWGYTHDVQIANNILQNSNRVIEIVGQWAPSITSISNDFKRIWTIINELRWTNKTKIKRHKDTKTERRKVRKTERAGSRARKGRSQQLLIYWSRWYMI